MDLSISDNGNYKIINLKGKINWEEASTLDKKVSSLIDEGFVHIAFIFDNVTSICSALIGALVFNLNKAKKLNGVFCLISSNKDVNSIFDEFQREAMVPLVEEFVELTEQEGEKEKEADAWCDCKTGSSICPDAPCALDHH